MSYGDAAAAAAAGDGSRDGDGGNIFLFVCLPPVSLVADAGSLEKWGGGEEEERFLPSGEDEGVTAP